MIQYYFEEQVLLHRNPFHVAVESSDVETVSLILDYIRETNVDLIHQRDIINMTPILLAAHRSNLPIFQLLEKAGACLNDRYVLSEGTLELACQANNVNIARHLLDHPSENFKVDGQLGVEPLAQAASRGSRDICMLLLAKGAEPSVAEFFSGKTAALYAEEAGYVLLADELAHHDITGLSTNQLNLKRASALGFQLANLPNLTNTNHQTIWLMY